jgi:hypothetical protein
MDSLMSYAYRYGSRADVRRAVRIFLIILVGEFYLQFSLAAQ